MGDDLFGPVKYVWTAAALVAAFAAALAALLGVSPAIAGWLAALSALAIAGAAATVAKDLHAPDDLTEPREPRGPSDVSAPREDPLTRRAFSGLWAYAGAAFALLAIVPFAALARRPAPGGTAWFRGARLVTPDGKPLLASDLEAGSVATVFPEGRVGAPESATVLLRVEGGVLPPVAGRIGWTPGNHIAYSKICTHAGCPVAIYRRASHQLYCPCHQSIFDVLDGARPVSGPATRALPQLALDVDEAGYLVAQGDFAEPVGPDSWWRRT